MSTLERWKAVSPYLDEALALPEAERSDWTDPALSLFIPAFRYQE